MDVLWGPEYLPDGPFKKSKTAVVPTSLRLRTCLEAAPRLSLFCSLGVNGLDIMAPQSI